MGFLQCCRPDGMGPGVGESQGCCPVEESSWQGGKHSWQVLLPES